MCGPIFLLLASWLENLVMMRPVNSMRDCMRLSSSHLAPIFLHSTTIAPHGSLSDSHHFYFFYFTPSMKPGDAKVLECLLALGTWLCDAMVEVRFGRKQQMWRLSERCVVNLLDLMVEGENKRSSGPCGEAGSVSKQPTWMEDARPSKQCSVKSSLIFSSQ